MTKLLLSDYFAKKLAVSFPPLVIEPVFEGYRLVCDRQRQWAINLALNATLQKGIGRFSVIIVIAAFFLFPIVVPLVLTIWPIFIPVIIFLGVYGALKLIFDPQFRQGLGFRFGFAPAEVIFSHYPLRVGQDDRLTFRRQLKENFWTQLSQVTHFPAQGRLRVDLICAERVAYTEGTDTITEVATVYEEQIYAHSLIGGDRQVKAYFNLHIPEQLPASFEGKTNQIRWLLKIEETYPNVTGQQTTYLTFVIDP